jgi:hypothetical protein
MRWRGSWRGERIKIKRNEKEGRWAGGRAGERDGWGGGEREEGWRGGGGMAGMVCVFERTRTSKSKRTRTIF